MKNYNSVITICKDLKDITHLEGIFKNELHFLIKNGGDKILIQKIGLTKYVFGNEQIKAVNS